MKNTNNVFEVKLPIGKCGMRLSVQKCRIAEKSAAIAGSLSDRKIWIALRILVVPATMMNLKPTSLLCFRLSKATVHGSTEKFRTGCAVYAARQLEPPCMPREVRATVHASYRDHEELVFCATPIEANRK